MRVARIYLRVSTDEQDLTRQVEIEHSTRAAGYYVAGVYREKASGARADRPELLRMIADLQPGEVVVAEKIDRISRLPLSEAEQLVGAIRAKGARLAVPGVVDLSNVAAAANGVAKIVLESVQECCSSSPCKWRATTTRHAANGSAKAATGQSVRQVQGARRFGLSDRHFRSGR
jgi:predicted site-specific integrase-resolvase